MDVYENRVFGTKIEAVSMQLMTLKFESLKRNDISKKKNSIKNLLMTSKR